MGRGATEVEDLGHIWAGRLVGLTLLGVKLRLGSHHHVAHHQSPCDRPPLSKPASLLPVSKAQRSVAKLDVALDYRPHQPLDMAMNLVKSLNAE